MSLLNLGIVAVGTLIVGFPGEFLICFPIMLFFAVFGLVIPQVIQYFGPNRPAVLEEQGQIMFSDSWGGWKKFHVLKRKELIGLWFNLLVILSLNIFLVPFRGANLQYLQTACFVNLGLLILVSMFFPLLGRNQQEENSFVKVTTTGIIVVESRDLFWTKDFITNVIKLPTSGNYARFRLGWYTQLHVKDEDGFLRAMESLLGEKWKSIYHDLSTVEAMGVSRFSEDPPAFLRSSFQGDWLMFLERAIRNKGFMTGFLILVVIFPVELFFFLSQPLGLRQTAGLLLLVNIFIALEIYLVYWVRKENTEWKQIELTTTRLNFIPLDRIEKIRLDCRIQESSSFIVFGSGGIFDILEVHNAPVFLTAMKQAMGPRWEEVYVDNVDKVKGHPRYSTLKDTKGFRSCPVCDIALLEETKECPLCELKLGKIRGKLEAS